MLARRQFHSPVILLVPVQGDEGRILSSLRPQAEGDSLQFPNDQHLELEYAGLEPTSQARGSLDVDPQISDFLMQLE